MKVISLIASTLLIVLISQDLTLGLPVNNSTVQNSCPEGSELIEGTCVPLDSTSHVSEVQSSTVPTEETTARQEESVTQSVSSESNTTCPFGMERGKDGVCSEMKPNQSMEVTSQLTFALTTESDADRLTESTSGSTTETTSVDETSSSGQNLNDCPEGTRRNRQGVCKSWRSSKMTKSTTQSMSDLTTELPTGLTTEFATDLTTEFNTESENRLTTEFNTESENRLTTEFPTATNNGIDATASRGKNLKNCPTGMMRNRQGICKPLTSFKVIQVTTPSMNGLTTELAADLTTEFATDLTTEFGTEADNQLTTEFNTEAENQLTTEFATVKNTGIDEASSRGKNLKNCPTGMKRNKQGVCKPLKSSKVNEVTTESMNGLTTESGIELTTEWAAEQSGDVDTTTRRTKNLKICPTGTKRNQNGACRQLRSPSVSDVVTQSPDDLTTEFAADLTTELANDLTTESGIELTTEWAEEQGSDVDTTTRRTKDLKSCPAGTKRNQQGVCKQSRSSTVSAVVTQSTDDLTTELNAESEIELTTERAEEQSDDVETTTRRTKDLKSCPAGTKRNQQGVCKKIGSSKPVKDNTKVVDEITTESTAEIKETSNENDCPQGTERNGQGACQKIKSADLPKTVTNLKELLKKDGSCPDNYKMIQGRCLYIKNKIVSTSFPIDSPSNDYAPVAIRPKSGNAENYKVESVPVLSDNSCPEGTVYSEYGLCQKHVALPKANRLMNFDVRCQNNYELVNGQCVPRNTRTQIKSKSTTPAIDLAESTTIMTENIDDEEASQSTSTVKSTTEGSDME